MPQPVIITCAPTGGIHTPTMSPHLPVTPEEIAQASIEAAEAVATSPEMASLNVGSLNFGIFPMLEKYSQWKDEWEPAFLEMTRSSYEWSVLAAGRNQMPFATQAAMLGGNLRVGMEDSLFIGPGELTSSNAAQVRKIRGIIEALGHQVATSAQARERLVLKGADRVTL